SVAMFAIAPIQDFLVQDSSARMNFPGRTGGNWSYRMPPHVLEGDLIEALRAFNFLYGRLPVESSEGELPVWDQYQKRQINAGGRNQGDPEPGTADFMTKNYHAQQSPPGPARQSYCQQHPLRYAPAAGHRHQLVVAEQTQRCQAQNQQIINQYT